jgi:hypothetical protein
VTSGGSEVVAGLRCPDGLTTKVADGHGNSIRSLWSVNAPLGGERSLRCAEVPGALGEAWRATPAPASVTASWDVGFDWRATDDPTLWTVCRAHGSRPPNLLERR